MAKPEKNGGGVLILKGDEVLLVKHGPKADHINDTYSIPAGKIEPGESPKETAKRELFEETGLITHLDDLIAFPNNYFEAEILFKDGRKILSSMTVFFCENYSGELTLSEETVPEWHKILEIKKLKLLPNVEQAIINAQDFLNK